MRRLGRAGCLLGLALALLVMSAPAAAKPLGVVPDLATGAQPPPAGASPGAGDQTVARTATVPAIGYQGGPVLHSSRTHLIFWAPSNHPELRFDPGYMGLMQRFLKDVARASRSTRSIYGITGQYRDSGGAAAYASTYAGHVFDTDPAPPSGCTEPATGPGWTTCLSDRQLREELARVIAEHHLPTDAGNLYFIVTPDGLGSCTGSDCALGGSHGGYCGYHSWYAHVLYAVIPYNAVPGHCQSLNPRPNGSTADPALSTIAHEQAESITDPYGDAWESSNGSEIADLCITSYGRPLGGQATAEWNETIAGGHFWLQELYSRITGSCAARPQPDSAAITTPAPIVAGEALRLTARARQPGGQIVAYNWNFGDGHGGRGRRPRHTYRVAGTYHVFLRVTDSAGNWAYAKRTVTVTQA
ncbi:MAG TPA: PKD domain-containing protein [Solirubrobacteraceae bacterium]|nr:PKD domain-containing protein [Solirubrobacteraceae bacterium]